VIVVVLKVLVEQQLWQASISSEPCKRDKEPEEMVMLHALDEDDGSIPELVDESESEDAGETITGGCSTNRMHNVMHQVTRVSIINDSGGHFTAPYYSGLDVVIQGQDEPCYNTIWRAMEQPCYHSYSRVDAINYAVVQPRRMNEGDAFVTQFGELQGDDACMPELVDDDDEEALGPVRPYGEVLSSFHVDLLALERSFMVTAWQNLTEGPLVID